MGKASEPKASDSETTPTPDDEEKKKIDLPKPYLEIATDYDDEVYSVGDGSPLQPKRTVSLDLTPLSCKSTDSQWEYHHPNQTVIIFDWDDTLCPSTTCMRQHNLSVLGSPPQGDLATALERLTAEAGSLLRRATELANKVVVVTNAEDGWVDLSCKAWMPGLQQDLKACEVASARSTWEPHGIASPAGWKARTFESVINTFYSRYWHQSWKNIISIGDAPHEREALYRVVRDAPQPAGSSKQAKCRSKSVKFVLRPSIQQLTRELQLLRRSLKEIVSHDDNLDLHFSVESLADPVVTTPRDT